VVKRLVITEEARLRFVTTETSFEEEVSVRRQRATVERVTPEASNTDPAKQDSAGWPTDGKADSMR